MHRNNFDFVRLCAALSVLVSHHFALNGLAEPVILNTHSLGGFGVLVFFSISGYLVAQSWASDPHVGRFASRRLLRIWPGLAAVVLTCAFVLGPWVSTLNTHDYFHDPRVREYLRNLYFSMRDGLPLRFDGNALPTAINGSLWTIPLELKCYVALALLGLTGLLRTKWPLLLITVGLAFKYGIMEVRGDLWMLALGWKIETRFLLEFGLFFAVGALLWNVSFASAKRNFLYLALAWIGAAAFAWKEHYYISLLLAVPITVLITGTQSTPFIRKAGRFGDLSYGVYIYAFPVQQTLIWLCRNRLPMAVVFIGELIVTGLLAWCSWHLIEKQALRHKPNRPEKGLGGSTQEGRLRPSVR